MLTALVIATLLTALPPSGDRLRTVIDQPLKTDPIRKNAVVGVTLVQAIDVENLRKGDGDSQLFVVTNLTTANQVCLGTIPAAGGLCDATRCALATSWTVGNSYTAAMNCTLGDPNMGSVVPGGMSRAFRYDGTRCLCMVASAITTNVQVERTVR